MQRFGLTTEITKPVSQTVSAVAILGVCKTETFYLLWIYNFIAHMRRRHHLCLLLKRAVPLLQTKGGGKEPENQQQSEHLRAAVAESSRLRPSLRLRWFLACALCFSDIASDFQYLAIKTFLLGGAWEWEQREISFSSIYTHSGNSKQRSPNPGIS